MLEKAELTLIIMLSKTKKVITTHLIVLCSVASRKLFYSIAWRVGTLSLQFVPPAEGGGMEIIMIYLLEDDENIRELVCYSLNVTGNEAEGFAAPSEFWRAVSENLPELVILDVMLPEEDGLQVLSKLRSRDTTSDIPVIMLTAKGSEFDKVMALDAGADDYITKPFGVMELVSRVKAVLRRSSVSSQGKTYAAGPLCLSVSKHMVTVSGNEVVLTYKEFELLKYLFENKGMVLTRDQILQHIWGYDFDGENRTVDVHIRTLRHKLSEAGSLIETIRGVGYRIGDR